MLNYQRVFILKTRLSEMSTTCWLIYIVKLRLASVLGFSGGHAQETPSNKLHIRSVLWIRTKHGQPFVSFSGLVVLPISLDSGWWFQTFLIFHFIYGMSSFPLTNSYFSRWLLHHQPGLVSGKIYRKAMGFYHSLNGIFMGVSW